jgi:release factor glutamine methyltransferase
VAATTAGTVGEALGAATDALEAAGVETPRLDAEWLLTAATGRDRAALAADPDAGVDPVAARRFGEMVRRRVRREPVAYILGRKGFRRIELAVDQRALIPRPETELLVEVALELRPSRVLDVGTGSGAVALAVADELPEADVVATDISPAALDLARQNATRLGLAHRVAFEHASLPAGGGEFDLLVANLPYVSEPEYRTLPPEIARFEPREAVVAGPAGLEAIAGLLRELTTGRVAANAVALEVGAGQAGAVEGLIRRAGYDAAGPRRDLAGIERVVVGKPTGR